MRSDYIQLPPMPSDMPPELIKFVWEFARMEEPDQKKILDFIQKNIKPDGGDSGEEKLLKMMEDSGGEASPYVKEFHSLLRELIGTLVAQACELAALVLQYYCIDEKSIKEISETACVPENMIELMARYYERKMK